MAEHGNARHNCCRAFISRMLGDSLSETFVDFYWPVNRLHLAIYICFAVSFSYTYLWLSRFLQAQCGTYRVFGGSIANCSFEVVGFLVYTWMTFLSLKASYLFHGFWGWRVGDHSCFRRKLLARKLIWYYDDVNGDRRKQLKESSFGSLLVLLDTLKSAHKTIVSLEQTMQLVRDSMQEAQIVMALNMLRQWGDKEAALNEAIVKFLLVLCLEQSEQERKWLRSEIRRDNLNDPAL